MLTCASIYPDDVMRERLADSHLTIALVSENGEALVTSLRRKKKKGKKKATSAGGGGKRGGGGGGGGGGG